MWHKYKYKYRNNTKIDQSKHGIIDADSKMNGIMHLSSPDSGMLYIYIDVT